MLSRYPHPIAFSIHLSRNQVVQTLGLAMVSLMGLSVAPWPVVLAWTVAQAATIVAEHRHLGLIARGGPPAQRAARRAPWLRILATTLYAAAAFLLFARGDLGVRLFAFSIMCASMVHVLMRHYRSPVILAASLSPYLFILTVVGFGMTRAELARGHWLTAAAPGLTILMMAVQFWSARGQLAGAWNELMTARLAAEERERAAEAANRAKSQFLATMSHELRTPLNGVLGMAQALRNDRLTPVQQQRVNVIRRSGESLLTVLNDLLDLSKVEAGALELEVAEFDLEHLARGVAAAYQPMAEQKGLTFALEIAPAARGAYLGDAPRIRRMLQSLCDNAVKFTEAGGVLLGVDREDDRFVFRIADTGIGIGRDDLEHLFEGFFQADSTSTRRYGGTGVGLAICGRLASLMDGMIEASSTPGEGSAFTLRLPLRRVEAPAAAPARTAPAPAAQPVELRVLAAEDNITNQLVLKTLLAPAGIAPTMVVNGREALDAWESQTWDIVLMDIQMPEMGGVEAARRIRAREQQTGRARTPIVAVTANAMTHQVVEYEAVGMDGVVAKPFDIGKLFGAMEAALAQASRPAAPGARTLAV